LKFFSSGIRVPAKIKGIFLRCKPDDIESVPQKESEVRAPQDGTSFSFVPKSNWGLLRKAVAISVNRDFIAKSHSADNETVNAFGLK